MASYIGSWNTVAPSASATRTSSSTAPSRPTASPATIAGARAASSASARSSTPSATPSGRTRERAGSSPETSSSRMSTGIETNTGPAGGAAACRNARRMSTGQVLLARDLDRVLEGALRDGDEVAAEHRVLDQVAAVLLAGGDDQRRARAARVEDHAQPVGEARGDVQVQERRPARGARVAVGHRDGGGLVQAQDVAQVVGPGHGVHERQLGRPGVPEDVLHSLAAQQLHQ